MQESFNPSGDYNRSAEKNFSTIQLEKRKEQRLEQSASHFAMPSKSFSRVTRSKANKMVRE